MLEKSYLENLENLIPFEGSENLNENSTTSEILTCYFLRRNPKTVTKSGYVQCDGNRNRSFHDLYYIVKAINPKVTESEVAKFIIDNIQEGVSIGDDRYLYGQFCSVVQKAVFNTSGSRVGGYVRDKSYNGMFDHIGCDDLSFNDIIEKSKEDSFDEGDDDILDESELPTPSVEEPKTEGYILPKFFVKDKKERNILQMMVPYDGHKGTTNSKDYLRRYFTLRCPATYLSDGTLQCDSGRNRSFYDLYYLCKAKFPRTSPAIVAKALFDLCHESIHGDIVDHDTDDNIMLVIAPLFCKDISKVVFMRSTSSEQTLLDTNVSDIAPYEYFDTEEIDDLIHLDLYVDSMDRLIGVDGLSWIDIKRKAETV